MSILARLKEKPSHVKTQYAFTGAIVVTGLIALVWTTTLPARFGAVTATMDSIEEKTDVASVKMGLDALMKQGLETEGDEFSDTDILTDPEVVDGALGDLGRLDEHVPTTTAQTAEIKPSMPPLEPLSSAPSPVVGTPTPTTTNSKPTIILIGTTTKKSE